MEIDDSHLTPTTKAHCSAGEYTAWTGAHVFQVIKPLNIGEVHPRMLALPDITRRLDRGRSKGYNHSRIPGPALEFPNLLVKCIGHDEVEAWFGKIPRFFLPAKRKDESI